MDLKQLYNETLLSRYAKIGEYLDYYAERLESEICSGDLMSAIMTADSADEYMSQLHSLENQIGRLGLDYVQSPHSINPKVINVPDEYQNNDSADDGESIPF